MRSEIQPDLPRVLISADRVRDRITELAHTIEKDYADSEQLVCIGILKGAVFFMVDLLQQVHLPLAVDFFQTSSYHGKEAGEIRIRKDIEILIRDKDVLLIEDIVDTGHTLQTILALLRFRGARSVKLCALLDKHEAREVAIPIHYSGFRIDDVFVVGYGLDHNELYRKWSKDCMYSTTESTPMQPKSLFLFLQNNL